jgi:prepilin-type N-terminal cleavage/methylation domain-containing protein
MPKASGTSRRGRLTSQRGVSLIETLVALGLFALCAATMGNYLVSQIRMSSSNYLYTQAYALAEEQLESTRALRFNDMVPGSKTVPVDGQNFIVTTSVLNDSPANGLKQITVNVSWKDPLGPKNVDVRTIYTEVQR